MRQKALRRTPFRTKPKERVPVEELRAMAAFKEAVRGSVCVVCGRTDAEAFEATGWRHQAHHAVRRQVLRRLGLPEYPVELAVCVCEEPCHRRHTSRMRRIRRSELPAGVLAFVQANGLELEYEREYPE